MGLFAASVLFMTPYSAWLFMIGLCILSVMLISLGVSHYVYDRSRLYRLTWIPEWTLPAHPEMVLLHAGFDESSPFLFRKYPKASWQMMDLYDPEKHSEPSIRRARRAYPPDDTIRRIDTEQIDWMHTRADVQFLFLAAHEVRLRSERIVFLKQLQNGLKEEGKVVIVEHLRNLPNFLAYTIGFLHFYSEKEWKLNFKEAGFRVEQQIAINPFVKAFILVKNGTAS
jgi:hypothetical protein